MATIRIGAQLHPQHTTYPSYADAVRTIEALGVDTIWDWDHFFPLYDEEKGDDHFEGWTLLAAMATITSRVEVGCLVTCNSYRNPALLSNMAKTVDHISGGRLILGLGAGWFLRDYRAFGYEFGTAPSRLQALRDAIPIIKQHLEADVPPPLRKIPLCIGGGGEKVTLKITAQHADIWNGVVDLEAFRHKNQVLTNWCHELGRDPAEVERSVLIRPDKLPQLDAFVEAGANHIILALNEPWNFSAVEQLVAWRNAQ